MKKSQTQRQYKKFDTLFAYFNKTLFGNRLPTAMLVHSRGSKNVGGHFIKNKWTRSDQRIHEISINPEILSLADPKFICSILVHEMVHLEQAEFGKCGTGGYHNKQYASWMERIGLVCSDTGRIGGKKTGFRMSHYIIEGGKFDRAFQEMPESYMLPFTTVQPTMSLSQRRSKKKKLSYCCKTCGSKLWGKAGINIVCAQCGTLMVCEGSELEDKTILSQENLIIKLLLQNILGFKSEIGLSNKDSILMFADFIIKKIEQASLEQNEIYFLNRIGLHVKAWHNRRPLEELYFELINEN